MDKGIVCDHGLDMKVLDRYDIVMSGHFHHKSTNGNVTYVGTPYEMTWADFKDPKGFHIFDTTNREMEFIRNPYDMFVKIFYDDTKQDFDWWKGYAFSELKSTYVKVVVVNKQNPYLFDHVIDSIYKASASDIAIVEDFNDAVLDSDDDLVDQAEDTITILNKYIDNLQLDVEPDKLKTIMRELYVEALNTEVAE